MTIENSCRHLPAPSIAAASNCCSGMFCKAARYSRKLKPIVHHSVVTTTEIIATFGSCNHATGPIPNSASTPLIRPSFGLYIQDQNITTTVEASRYGMKNDSRHNHRPGSPRFTSNANASDNTTSGTVLSTVNHNVLPSDRHMSGS